MHEQLERETKWTVGDHFVVPPLDDAVPGAHVEIAVIDLESVYYDTAGHDLGAHGIVVRRRSGDDDTGWHVKLPVEEGRVELHWPASESMPDELSHVLAGVSLGEPLRDITTIRTHRRRHRVKRGGATLLELDDDGVRASSGADLLAWRDIEVELGEGIARVPKTLRKRLKAAGARHPRYPSKVARATGVNRPRRASAEAPTAFAAYLDAQIDQIIRGDIELRRGHDPIHDTRVAIRRTRSILRVFARHLDPGVGAFDAELKWFAEALGHVRDAQVQQHRFADALDDIAPELVLGPVHARIRSHLQGVELPASKAIDDAMSTERYLDILKTLRRWRTDPPLVGDISVQALRDDARRASRKARRRLRRALDHDDTALLHGARKAAKRARYAAELVAPVDGSARRRIKEHKRVQSVLGDHQDAVVAMDVLRRLGATAGTSTGENGFTLGILYAREQRVAAQCRALVHALMRPA